MTSRGLVACLALVVMVATGCGADPLPSTTATATSTASLNPTPTPSPIPIPTAGVPSAQLPADALDREAFGWQMVAPELDPATSDVIGHWLSVGTLASETPTWTAKLVESPWGFTLFTERVPVVDGPVAGTVIFVADDGVTSELRVVGIDGVERPVAGSTEQVVFAARLAPDAGTVYVVLLDRATGRDLGVFALRLGGSGDLVQVLPPPAVDQADAGTVRLVAVTRFVRALRVSPDGSLLARLACGEPFGRCVLDVIGLPDGPMLHYEPPDGGVLGGIGAGYALGIWSCPAETESCVVSAVSLEDGSVVELPGYPPAIDAEGRLVLLVFPGPTVETGSFSLFDPATATTRQVFSTDGTVRPLYADGLDFEGVRVEVPAGWAPVWVSQSDGDGYTRQAVAVRLSDGGWLPITVPPLLSIGGGHD